mmetsp:Transcript_137165/g.273664  ORF Transcript_137165/g.273664 Transcript_137165/m.273664 type:complete len:263 (-) Transcript_137165:2658-3446(-)
MPFHRVLQSSMCHIKLASGLLSVCFHTPFASLVQLNPQPINNMHQVHGKCCPLQLITVVKGKLFVQLGFVCFLEIKITLHVEIMDLHFRTLSPESNYFLLHLQSLVVGYSQCRTQSAHLCDLGLKCGISPMLFLGSRHFLAAFGSQRFTQTSHFQDILLKHSFAFLLFCICLFHPMRGLGQFRTQVVQFRIARIKCHFDSALFCQEELPCQLRFPQSGCHPLHLTFNSTHFSVDLAQFLVFAAQCSGEFVLHHLPEIPLPFF